MSGGEKEHQIDKNTIAAQYGGSGERDPRMRGETRRHEADNEYKRKEIARAINCNN